MVKRIIVISLLIIVILTVCYLVFVDPFVNGGNYAEIRFYARLFLLLVVISTFGILRSYNATVNNTRFLIKLHKLLGGVLIELPKTNKAITDAKVSSKALREGILKNIESLRELAGENEQLRKSLDSFKNKLDA